MDPPEIIENKEEQPEIPDPAYVATDTVYIIDQTGKKWDISHAVASYGFKPEKFQFGLGPNAIKPIMNPEMICPGEPGYPDETENGIVIGVSLDEPLRAYPLNIMATHEIANENIEGTHVAVAY